MSVTGFCFHCGEHVDEAWRFCRECGAGVDIAPVATRSAFCTECGMGLAESWRFCVRCGTSTPVAKKARSVHLSPQEAARWAGVSAPVGSEIGAMGTDAPSVELISRTYDVIDLRPVETEEELAGDTAIDHPLLHRGISASRTAMPYERPTIEETVKATTSSASVGPPAGSAATAESAPADQRPVDDPADASQWSDDVATDEVDADALPPPPWQSPPALEPRRDRSASAPGRLRDRVASMEARRKGTDATRAVSATTPQATVTTELAPAAMVSSFRNSTRVGQLAQLAFLLMGSIAVATVVALVILNNRLEEFGLAVEGDYARVETAQRIVDSWLRPILLLLGLAAVTLFAVWGHRAYSNLTAFGKTDLRLPAHAALWSWLVPVVNFVLPRKLIDDAWRGSDVYAFTDPAWKRRPGNAWLRTAWWAAGAFIVCTLIGQLIGAATVESAMDANAWAMLGYGALILTSLTAVRAIAAITDRQETRARGLLGKI